MRGSQGLLGLFGIVLLLFAGVDFFLTQGAGAVDMLYIGLHAGFGVLALIGYLSAGLENLRSFVGERSTKYGVNAVVSTLFFFGIVASLAYLTTRYHHRFDLTEANVYSLSPQSKKIVANLDRDLKLQAFVEGGTNPELRNLLDSYGYASQRISYEMIDPDRHPELAEKHGISSYNTVRLAYGGDSTMVTQPSEETVTNAIVKVTRKTQQKICFIDGHGEPDLDAADDPHGLSQAKTALTNEHYLVEKVLLASRKAVPEDCSAVIVAGPRKPYLAHEISALEAYLKEGGHAAFLLPPRSGGDLAPLLDQWGVKLGQDVVVDQVYRLFAGPALGLEPLADQYGAHEITRDFKRGKRTLFPMTRSVQTDTAARQGLQATDLVKTSPSSWAETDVAAIFDRREATLGEGEQRGPVSIAVVVQGKLDKADSKSKEARLAVFGSVEFVDNRNFNGTFFNSDLFLNTAGWLVGQSDLLSIRARSLRSSRLRFSRDEGTIVFYLSVLVLPELLLMLGLAVWWKRE